MSTEINEEDERKISYPSCVYYIYGNGFCENFAYFGIRVALPLYLTIHFSYSTNEAVAAYHLLNIFLFFLPLVGAILADSWLGKFKTICCFSMIYSIGDIFLYAVVVPMYRIPLRWFAMIPFLFVILGAGLIKPCIPTLGGDQFVLPQQFGLMSKFFSSFYFFSNFGYFASACFTFFLREDIVWWNDLFGLCLAFFVPCVAVAVSTVIFLLGTPSYKMKKLEGNIITKVLRCICHAIGRKIKSSEDKKHWLDHSDDAYDQKTIESTKKALQIIKLFIPLPLFWALYDQRGSRWIFQAANMSGDLGFYDAKPYQTLIINPILVIMLIPIFNNIIYPIMGKIRVNTPLRKLVLGCIFACGSFVATAFVESELEKSYPVMPSSGFAQVRVFNTLNCPIDVSLGNEHFIISNLEMWTKKDFVADDKGLLLNYNVDYKKCRNFGNSIVSGSVPIYGGAANFLIATASGLNQSYIDAVDRSLYGEPYIRFIFNFGSKENTAKNLTLDHPRYSKKIYEVINSTLHISERKLLDSGTYDLLINNKSVQPHLKFPFGGVYAIVGTHDETGFHVKVATITDPNSINILWLLPQNIALAIGEVLFCITGLEFAYSQAPENMKSLLTAAWFLTIAFGNLLVVIVTKAKIFHRLLNEFIFFAVLMGVSTIVFAVMAKFYKYTTTAKPIRNGITPK